VSDRLYYSRLLPGCLFDAPVHICPSCRQMTASDSLPAADAGRWACGHCGSEHSHAAGEATEIHSLEEAAAALLEGVGPEALQ
jgi:ribosomal protein L37AE/L43A